MNKVDDTSILEALKQFDETLDNYIILKSMTGETSMEIKDNAARVEHNFLQIHKLMLPHIQAALKISKPEENKELSDLYMKTAIKLKNVVEGVGINVVNLGDFRESKEIH